MQKIVNLLEQHVQWLAIALGAAFALFMIYTYVLQSPTQVQIGNESMGPGEVTRTTNEKVASELKQKIETRTNIKLNVPKPAEQFKTRMAWGDKPETPLTDMWVFIPSDVYKESAAPVPPEIPGQVPGGAPPAPGVVAQVVNDLPVPPKPQVAEAKVGRSVIVPPGANGQPAAAAAAVAPGQLPPGAIDKDWVTQTFKVSLDGLAAEFKRCGLVKDPFNKTSFLVVEMVRQEILPDGRYGKEEPVAPLGVTWAGPPAPPWPGEAPPPAKATQDELLYMNWADQNVRDVLEPPFFQVFKGDPWAPPGAPVDPNALFDPATTKLKPEQMTPQQKQQWLDYNRQQAQKREEDRKQKAKGGARPGGGGRSPTGEGGATGAYAPKDTARPAPNRPPPPAARPPRPPLGSREGLPPPAAGVISAEGDVGGVLAGIGGAPPAPANLPQPGVSFPNNPFDPGAWAGKDPMTVWVHDADVKPGRQYRYKMRYRIKNPIFGVQGNVAKNPAWVNQMTIASEFSDWSKPVMVPALTNFFIARGIRNGIDLVDFEVFTWKDGKQHSEMFKVAPGDGVGAAKGEVDFATGWIFLGLQEDPRNASERLVLLVDKDGTVIARNRKADEGDPLYRTLKDQVASVKAGEAVTAGASAGPGIAPAAVGGH